MYKAKRAWWLLVQFNNLFNLPLIMHTPPSYVGIAVGSAVVHHVICHLKVLSPLIRPDTRWHTVLPDRAKKSIQHCCGTVVGGC